MGQTYRFNGRGMEPEPSPQQRQYLASEDCDGALANRCPYCGKQTATAVIRTCYDAGWTAPLNDQQKDRSGDFWAQWVDIPFRLTDAGRRLVNYYRDRRALSRVLGVADGPRLSRLMVEED